MEQQIVEPRKKKRKLSEIQHRFNFDSNCVLDRYISGFLESNFSHIKQTIENKSEISNEIQKKQKNLNKFRRRQDTIQDNPYTQQISLFEEERQRNNWNSFGDFLIGNGSVNCIESPFTGRKLKPFIWRDFKSNSNRMKLYDEIKQNYNKRYQIQPKQEEEMFKMHSIDYCYLRPEYLNYVNNFLCEQFWPSIDVREFLEYPDYSICALYKKLIIGCGFVTPEGYITYIAVHPGWRNCGIASFMLFHLTQIFVL